MNKLFLLFGFFFGLVGIVKGGSYYDGWNFTEVTASSKTFDGPLRVRAIFLSHSASNADGTHYAVLLTTPTPTANSSISSFTTDHKKSPALLFRSTSTANTDELRVPAIDYGPDGISVSTNTILWKSSEASGETYKAFLLWRK